MNNNKRTENFKRLKKAWAKLPQQGKTIVFQSGFSRQTVSDILLNGRTDLSIIDELLKVVKKASKKALHKLQKNNDTIQSL